MVARVSGFRFGLRLKLVGRGRQIGRVGWLVFFRLVLPDGGVQANPILVSVDDATGEAKLEETL